MGDHSLYRAQRSRYTEQQDISRIVNGAFCGAGKGKLTAESLAVSPQHKTENKPEENGDEAEDVDEDCQTENLMGDLARHCRHDAQILRLPARPWPVRR